MSEKVSANPKKSNAVTCEINDAEIAQDFGEQCLGPIAAKSKFASATRRKIKHFSQNTLQECFEWIHVDFCVAEAHDEFLKHIDDFVGGPSKRPEYISHDNELLYIAIEHAIKTKISRRFFALPADVYSHIVHRFELNFIHLMPHELVLTLKLEQTLPHSRIDELITLHDIGQYRNTPISKLLVTWGVQKEIDPKYHGIKALKKLTKEHLLELRQLIHKPNFQSLKNNHEKQEILKRILPTMSQDYFNHILAYLMNIA